MRIIAADDEEFALMSLEKAIHEAAPDAEVICFLDPEEVVAYAKKNEADVAFLDIEMGTMSGIEVARELKLLHPKINIIFATGYDKYMGQAIQLRMSGYVMKPVTKEKVLVELEDLKYPVPSASGKTIFVRCFGNFEVFINGSILNFEKAKTKELLAYLVDRRGSGVTTGELRSILWDDAQTDGNTRSYLSKLKKDLVQVLKEAGAKNIFLEKRGSYAIDPAQFSCDYYDFLDGRPDGIRAYNGEYMSQYSWAEERCALLQNNHR